MSKYGVISGPYFPVFGLNTGIYGVNPNTGKYGPEITPYLDTFHAVHIITIFLKNYIYQMSQTLSDVVVLKSLATLNKKQRSKIDPQ